MHIDWWTIGLQAVNFLVLMWLLTRFFYRPVTAMMATRQSAIRKQRDDAAKALRDAEAARAEITAQRADAAAERSRVLAAAEAKAEALRASLIEDAGKEAAALRQQAEADLARAERLRDADLATHAQDLAVTIAGRLLARLPEEARDAAFADGLLAAIAAMPPATAAALKAAPTLDLVSAAPLPEAVQARIGTALAGVLGSEPELSLTVDPAVLAGIELRSADIVLSNSWRADLARIRQEMAHDD